MIDGKRPEGLVELDVGDHGRVSCYQYPYFHSFQRV
jgi:hypothetical protein